MKLVAGWEKNDKTAWFTFEEVEKPKIKSPYWEDETIFGENKRPKFTINEINEAILDAFAEQHWIAGYEEDEKRKGYYKLKKWSNRSKNDDIALL